MKKLLSLVGAIAFSIVAGVASANAATYPLPVSGGTLDPGEFAQGSKCFFITLCSGNNENLVGAFIDSWTLTAGSSGSFGANGSPGSTGVSPITDIQLQWFDATGTIPISAIVGNGGVATALLTAGLNYIIKITGTASAGSTYVVNVSSVPVPPALLLLFSGLGGLVFLRRAQKPATA